MQAKIAQENENQISVASPFSRDFIEALKAAVPYTDRKWDSANKVWLVGNGFAAEAVAVTSKYFEVLDARTMTGEQIAEATTAAEEAAIEAEIAQIQENQKFILKNEEWIAEEIEKLDAKIERYSPRSKSSVKYGLARDRALLQHSLDNARLPLVQLVELHVRGLAATVRYVRDGGR